MGRHINQQDLALICFHTHWNTVLHRIVSKTNIEHITSDVSTHAGALSAPFPFKRMQPLPDLSVPMTPNRAFHCPVTPFSEALPIPMTPGVEITVPMTPGLGVFLTGANPCTPPYRLRAPERRVRVPLHGFDWRLPQTHWFNCFKHRIPFTFPRKWHLF